MDHHALLSPIGQRPLLDGIRGLVKHETPSVISLLAGRPNPETFPFASITLHLSPPLGSEPGTNGQDLELNGEESTQALSYGPSAGWPNLNAGLVKFQEEVHNRPADDSWRLTVGAGCQDLISKAFHVLISPNDYVLVESPTYSGTLSMLSVIGDCQVVEVSVDSEGLDPIHLSEILDNWDESKKKPTVVYTVPVGSNPTGCSASKERKLEILKICSKHGILILEDDPYYFLTTDIVPSYFELETQVVPGGGQVVRFDSFSKILSSGLRLGYAVGPKKVLDAMDVYTACVNLQPSSMSQAIVWALMSNWGTQAFLEHCKKVAVLYETRRVWFEELAHKHLDGLATWVSPKAGMFLFIDISPLTDARALALTTALAHGVLVVPGSSFYASAKKCSQLRVAFSIIERDAADEALRRLGAAIKEARVDAGVV